MTAIFSVGYLLDSAPKVSEIIIASCWHSPKGFVIDWPGVSSCECEDVLRSIVAAITV